MSSSRQRSCAPCKQLKRKCSQDCIFHPYFPQQRLDAFLNVHWLFGVNIVIKKYNSVDSEHRDALMESLIYEAEMRRKDPVYGCIRVISDLETKLHSIRRELEVAKHHLAFQKRCEQQKLLIQKQQQQQRFSEVKVKLEMRGDGATKSTSSKTKKMKVEESFGNFTDTEMEDIKPFSNLSEQKIEGKKWIGNLLKPKIEKD